MSTMHENIVGLYVTNDDLYSTYRQKMIPILESYGGGFRYDFQIAEVLTNDSDVPINRLFAIYFDNKEKMEQFFADPAYVAVRGEFFAPAVDGVTVIASYDRPDPMDTGGR